MKKYAGGCHCGAVKFEVELDLENPETRVISCNCSHCHIKGFILTFVESEHFRLISGEDNLTEYRFNKNRIAHLFCKTCGVQSFGRGVNREGKPTMAINLRCVKDIDLDKLKITPVNGKDF